jgi:hypothetical protein
MPPFEIAAIGSLVTLLLGIIGKLTWNWKVSVDQKQAALEVKQAEIVGNYISRFDDVKTTINTTEKNILEKISEVNIQIANITPIRKRKRS